MMDERVWRGLEFLLEGNVALASTPDEEKDIQAAVTWVKAMRRWYRS